MKRTRWIPRDVLLAIHDELLSEHGGLRGVRDDGLLDASLARPRNKHAYAGANVYRLAAAYGYSFARNHPFHDGNKRVALSCVDVFLRLNGYELVATEVDAVTTLTELAAGDLEESAFASWIEQNSRVRT